MARARTIYFSFLGAALALFTTASALAPKFGDAWSVGLLHFIVFAAALACAAATWGTAVMIASVHKVAWPLTLSTSLIVMACFTLLVQWFRHVA